MEVTKQTLNMVISRMLTVSPQIMQFDTASISTTAASILKLVEPLLFLLRTETTRHFLKSTANVIYKNIANPSILHRKKAIITSHARRWKRNTAKCAQNHDLAINMIVRYPAESMAKCLADFSSNQAHNFMVVAHTEHQKMAKILMPMAKDMRNCTDFNCNMRLGRNAIKAAMRVSGTDTDSFLRSFVHFLTTSPSTASCLVTVPIGIPWEMAKASYQTGKCMMTKGG